MFKIFSFRPELPIFDPSAFFGQPQLPRKWQHQKFVYLVFCLKNVVEAFSDSIVSVTSVEISFFMPIFLELYRKVEWCCLTWGIYARFVKKMADSSQLIFLLTLVPTTLRQGDDGRSPWQFGWWWSRAKDHKNLSYWVLLGWDPGDKTSNQSNEKFLEQRPWNWFC